MLITLPVATSKLSNDSTFLFQVSGVTTVSGDTVPDYSTAVSFADHTAPTSTGVTYVNNNTARINFSEGMTALAGSSVQVFDGSTNVTGTGLQSVSGVVLDGDKSLNVDLTNAEVNKSYTVKVYGAMDLYGNFLGTQTYTVVKSNADTVKPTVTSVEAKSLNTFVVNFSEPVEVDPTTALNGYGDFTVGSLSDKLIGGTTNVDTVTPSTDGKSLTVVLTAVGTDTAGTTTNGAAAGDTPNPGLEVVSVNNFFDLSGNQQTTAFTKVTNFTADTTAPKVLSTTVSGNKLYVKFDDTDVQVQTVSDVLSNVTYVNDSVEYAAVDFGTAILSDADGDGHSDTIEISLVGAQNGTYKATLKAGVVKDTATNASVATAVNFAYNSAADTTKPKVMDSDNDKTNGITGASFTAQSVTSPSTITLTFDKAVSTTALDLNNYLIDGSVAFKDATFVGDKQHVRLTLKDNEVPVTAVRAFTVKNVTSSAGVAMDAITFNQNFVENVAPTLTSATLTSPTSITLKFGEKISAATAADFELWVGGVKGTVSSISTVTPATDTITLTVPAFQAADLAKSIQVKLVGTGVLDNSTVKNAATAGQVVNVQQ